MADLEDINLTAPTWVDYMQTTPWLSTPLSTIPNYLSSFVKSGSLLITPLLQRDYTNYLFRKSLKPVDPSAFRIDTPIIDSSLALIIETSTEVNPVSGDTGTNKGAMAGLIMSVASQALNGMSDAIFGQKRGIDGPNAGITTAIDSAYDTASDAVMQINPMVGGIMKAAGFVGNTLNKVGGGTDGMTKTDAVFNSAPMTLATLGLNGFLGDTTESMTKNEEAFAQVGSSYGGTGSIVDDALSKAGKKYGLLSGGARTEANRLIRKAKTQQEVMAGIGDRASDTFAILSSMAAINGNQRSFAMQGGYDQSAIRVGKSGIKLKKLESAKRLVEEYRRKLKEGGRVSTPTEIILTKEIDEFKGGGSITFHPTYIELVVETPEFQEGGSINVIPEGALHARLHHMENADNLTKKGIPVVAEKEGGEIEQQAEIEREEIIFRLEVTKKLEELVKEGSDEAALEAGKLLVQEILYNTIDNTNNLLQ